jgi:hypothetical protein
VGCATERDYIERKRAAKRILAAGGASGRHFEFTRINIEPIILRKKIEDAGEVSTVRIAFTLSFALGLATDAARRDPDSRSTHCGEPSSDRFVRPSMPVRSLPPAPR